MISNNGSGRYSGHYPSHYNSNKSSSVGVSTSTDGLLLTASASRARGNADGGDVTWTNTHVHAGDQITLTSGNDTMIKGAVVTASQVTVDTGNDLNIESQQDVSRFDSSQHSVGGSISLGQGRIGGNLSVGKSKIGSDFASVTEQSGFRAGDGDSTSMSPTITARQDLVLLNKFKPDTKYVIELEVVRPITANIGFVGKQTEPTGQLLQGGQTQAAFDWAALGNPKNRVEYLKPIGKPVLLPVLPK